jgi:ElaB/YqjD/DUF883 family membrane-anchored ribosome-binding protein
MKTIIEDVAQGEQVQRALDALVQATEAIRGSGEEIAGAVGGYVRTHPVKTLLGAGAAGLLLGLLLARR